LNAAKLQKEGQILLAVNACHKDQVTNISHLAHLYNVPQMTLKDQIKGCVARVNTRANCHKLTETEEDILEQRVISMDKQGWPLTIGNPGVAARLIQSQRVGGSGDLGVNWP
jgi:hypothetical protein